MMADIEQWRRERERKLTEDKGWLTVAGLFWLKEGTNTIGSSDGADVQLPEGYAWYLGAFELYNGKTRFVGSHGVNVMHGAESVSRVYLKADTDGGADRIAIGDLTMHVIHRGQRYGIRLTDKNSEYRRNFKGLHWYPADEKWRVGARFVPYDPPKKIPMLSMLGDTEMETSPGYVEFRLLGQDLKLEPVWSGKRLFFVLRDLTTGKTTYSAGRFLYADPPKDGVVVLDFNKTENPPCAFTPHATCPLPPKQNHLPVAIQAGELNYK
jgi:hypothetical protein